MNEQDYSIDGVLFQFQPAVQVLGVEPSRGPVDGGSFVNVTGTGFSHRAALLAQPPQRDETEQEEDVRRRQRQQHRQLLGCSVLEHRTEHEPTVVRLQPI